MIPIVFIDFASSSSKPRSVTQGEGRVTFGYRGSAVFLMIKTAQWKLEGGIAIAGDRISGHETIPWDVRADKEKRESQKGIRAGR
jgi:hypothetical protein